MSSEEKTSLRNILNRLGNPVPKVSASDLTEKVNRSGLFSSHQATSLVDELLARIGYALDAAGREYLVSLLREMPFRAGDVFEIVDAYYEPLIVAAEVRAKDQDEGGYPADIANLVFQLASELHRKPNSKIWFDLQAFTAETSRLNAILSKDRTDSEKEYLRFLQQISNSGLLRRFCHVPSPTALMELMTCFPHFEEPLRFLAEQAAFAYLRGESNAHFVPMLLTGPAGIGKTHFAMALAELVGSRTEMLNMASQSCGFAISGMDRGWSSARPGLVFDALLRGETLSPIMILDEIDKASQENKSDPLSPLYALLEPKSSCAFKDEYAGVDIDASQVLWIATANDASKLPGPLLSRFKVFNIEEPRAEQISSIANRMFAEIAAGVSGAPAKLPEEWRDHLAGHSVREIRIALQQALGKAALRAVMSGQDEIRILDRDLTWPHEKTGKRIGFC